jgi:Arc/MetJ family transcription regulator
MGRWVSQYGNMGRMKTTVEITDALLDEAKRIAAREDTSLRALIEDGLRQVVAERKRGSNFHLRRATFKGNGLHPGVEAGGWELIRDLSYKGRGA